MPKQLRLLNVVELINEFLIQAVSVHMFLYTDFIHDETTKFGIGFSMIGFIGLVLLYNLSFVFYFGLKSTYLIYKKYKNQFVHKYLTEKKIEESSEESSSESEINVCISEIS